MENMPPMIHFRKTVVVCMGFMLAMGWGLTPIGAHDNQPAVSPESAPGATPSLPSTNDTADGSVIIGDGIRTPPDIGVAGTASPTPPLRFESPTDQPDIFPETTPVTPGSSPASEGFPSTEPTPMGQPELFNK